MDLFGIAMGFVTIPMALLTVASLFGGVALLAWGAWQPVVLGVLAFGLGYGVATILERAVIAIDDAAALSLNAGQRHRARIVAVLSGGLPMLVILGWEYACFRFFLARTDAPLPLLWLWSYGVATGPWSLFAQRVSRFRRTLCGIRSYAGHLAYWLLTLLTLLGAPPPLALGVMLLPAILPFVVGLLLAVADREALINVRV